MNPEYLAGFFDGEGCINITVRGASRQVVLRCMLVNCDFELLQTIQSEFGGSLSKRAQKNKPAWKPFCCLTWNGKQAARLLWTLRPFLRLKAKQVALALEFDSFMQLPKTARCDFVHKPAYGMPARVIGRRKPEVIAKELEYKRQLHELNRKGQLVQ